MEPTNDEDIAEFIRLFESLQPPAGDNENADGDIGFTPGWGFTVQQEALLESLHDDDMQSHINNNTWLQQIDYNVKTLQATLDGVVIALVIAGFLCMLLALYVLPGCGG